MTLLSSKTSGPTTRRINSCFPCLCAVWYRDSFCAWHRELFPMIQLKHSISHRNHIRNVLAGWRDSLAGIALSMCASNSDSTCTTLRGPLNPSRSKPNLLQECPKDKSKERSMPSRVLYDLFCIEVAVYHAIRYMYMQ